MSKGYGTAFIKDSRELSKVAPYHGLMNLPWVRFAVKEAIESEKQQAIRDALNE